MSRSLYFLLIFYLTLTAFAGIFHGILHLQLGPRLFWLDSFLPWFSAINILSLATNIILLRYFHSRKYRSIFYMGSFATLLHLLYTLTVYIALISGKTVIYSTPLQIFSILANISYAATVLFTKIEDRYWLNLSAISAILLSTIYAGIFLGSRMINSTLFANKLQHFDSWIILVGTLPTLFLIAHFFNEVRRVSRADIENRVENRFKDIMLLLLFPMLVCTALFGVMIASETSSTLYWEKRSDQHTSELFESFEARRFTNKQGEILRYRLLKPLNYDSSKLYPLVISLPYGGQPGTDTIRQIDGAAAAEMLSVSPYRESYQAFIFVPNCPPGSGWGGSPDYPSADALVYEAITDLDDHFSIDKKRRYVTGISRGGYGTWHFISTRPDLFAAAVPVCGGGNPNEAAKAIDVAVWAFHGAKDRNVPVSGSRDMINAIKKAGGNPKYTEYQDQAHNIWNEVKITPGLIEWLFAQKRD